MSDLLDEVTRPEEPVGSPGAVRRAGRAERDRRRRQRRRRSLIALVVAVLLLGGAAWAVQRYVLPSFADISLGSTEDTSDYAGPGSGAAEVVVAQGATGEAMGQALVDAGVVRTVGAFTDAFAADPGAAGIQPGTYRLLLQMKAADAVRALQDQDNRVQTRVTIPEGLQTTQVLERLSAVTAVPIAEFQTAMADTAATGLPAEANGSYEGWLFGSTYEFEPGTTPAQMIGAMVARTVGLLDERGVAPADRVRVLTMASLVEGEARTPEDRARVARAIQNRLDIDMKLDIDASVAYGAGKNGSQLTDEDLATDTPYNLYVNTGLPPTPINSPSTISVDAVLSPAEGPWFFWVAINTDTGETRFAETFAEHQQNVALLRAWQAEQG